MAFRFSVIFAEIQCGLYLYDSKASKRTREVRDVCRYIDRKLSCYISAYIHICFNIIAGINSRWCLFFFCSSVDAKISLFVNKSCANKKYF